jgi:hypothetical protein
MTDALAIGLSLVGLAAAALGIVAAWRAPRCAPCGVISEALPAELVATLPAVLEITYRCPQCGAIVGRRRVGEWD